MNYQHLSAYGLSKEIQEMAVSDDFLFLARVTLQQRDFFLIETEEGAISAQVSGKFIYEAIEETSFPVVGDWVLVKHTDDTHEKGTIVKVLPRKSFLKRKAPGPKEMIQAIASNIDTILICMSMDLDFNLRRLERYLSIVWNSGARPVVVLTKSDLAVDYERQLLETEQICLGAEVLTCSNQSETGYDELLPYIMSRKTYALIGSSGVGKSSIINYFLGEEFFATNGLRKDHRGKHTTTSRQMVLSPYGALVIDTPGMREIQIESIELDASFSDIEDLGKTCKFRDCTHTVEPGCSVKLAVDEKLLDSSRLKNYHKMKRELNRTAENTRKNLLQHKTKK
ncbi:MAG: ribosome small subunit-dependent GTPase A [Firmicutes bacterium]|nr:ribosome small subunit-dependent GTPase A [Bacillota bacterium]